MTISFMTWVCPDWDLNEVLTAAIRYDYDGVEPRAQTGHPHGVEITATKKERAAIKAQFADCSILMPCIATSIQYANWRLMWAARTCGCLAAPLPRA